MTATATKKTSTGFTRAEQVAMRERAKELKAEARRGVARAEGETAVRAKIAEMAAPDRQLAERLHGVIQASAPSLAPKTWYGMPAYARDDKVVCFFQSAEKFSTRYATLGFSDEANLDDGSMWATAFALPKLTAADLIAIGALVKRAATLAPPAPGSDR